MTDNAYLLQYFLDHSPKDDKPKTATVPPAKRTVKKAKAEDKAHE